MERRPRLVFLAVVIGVALLTLDPVYRVRMRVRSYDPIYFDPAILALYTVIGVVGVAVLMSRQRWRRVPRPLLVAFGAFSGWCVLSTLWSVDPRETFGRSLFVASALVVGAAAALAVPLRSLVWALWTGLHLPLLWSAWLVARSGTNAYDWNDDARGAFSSRNVLGMYAAMAIIAGLLLAVDVLRRRELDARTRATIIGALVAATAMDVWLLVLTGSATPVAALVVAVAVIGLALLVRRLLAARTASRSARATARAATVVTRAGGAAAVAVVGMVWLSRSWWSEHLGRSSDLTGRLDIWETALDWWGDRPLHGLGYLGAWTSEERQVEAQMAAEVMHPVTHAHNSLVDALLGGGLIGFVTLLLVAGLAYGAVVRLALSTRTVLALAPLALFAFVIAENLAETFFVGNNLNVALLAATAVAAAMFDPHDVDTALGTPMSVRHIHGEGTPRRH